MSAPPSSVAGVFLPSDLEAPNQNSANEAGLMIQVTPVAVCQFMTRETIPAPCPDGPGSYCWEPQVGCKADSCIAKRWKFYWSNSGRNECRLCRRYPWQEAASNSFCYSLADSERA